MCVAASVGSIPLQSIDLPDSAAEPVDARLEALLQSGRGRRPASAASAAASRVLPSLSAMPMLRESSTTTAMMFCCELSAETDMAGCQSKQQDQRHQRGLHAPDRPRAPAVQLWRSARAVCERSAARGRRRTRAISTGNSHAGHGASSTKRPLVKTGLGYLKRN